MEPDMDDLEALLNDSLNDFDDLEKRSATAPQTEKDATPPVDEMEIDKTHKVARGVKAGMKHLLQKVENGDKEALKELKELASEVTQWTREEERKEKEQKEEKLNDSLQQTINKALEEIEANREKLEQTQGGGEPDVDKLVESFLGDWENNDSLQGVMQNMMQQLMSKDILQEPLKELGNKYPEYLKANKDKLTAEEYSSYEKQFEVLQEILAAYDNNAEFDDIMGLLQKMQSHGQPPTDLLKELTPDIQFDGQGYPVFPSVPGGKDGACSLM
mmetsp:Transcript_4348/g.4781  ORF Transcript_4348/g.4781 Transcript_4348/m.4781 type:complete len:273 (-) Transcript_4348:66-884(-)